MHMCVHVHIYTFIHMPHAHISVHVNTHTQRSYTLVSVLIGKPNISYSCSLHFAVYHPPNTPCPFLSLCPSLPIRLLRPFILKLPFLGLRHLVCGSEHISLSHDPLWPLALSAILLPLSYLWPHISAHQHHSGTQCAEKMGRRHCNKLSQLILVCLIISLVHSLIQRY